MAESKNYGPCFNGRFKIYSDGGKNNWKLGIRLLENLDVPIFIV